MLRTMLHTTIQFTKLLFPMLAYTAPLWLSLILVIVVLGLIIGHKERWSKMDALYYAFITATTVGYGDFRPQKKISKLLAIFIAFTGIIFTGLVVALALRAAQQVFEPQGQ